MVACLKGVVFEDSIKLPALPSDTGRGFRTACLLYLRCNPGIGVDLVAVLNLAEAAYLREDRRGQGDADAFD